MTDEGYNGWTNWETWCAVLWARNTESMYAWWRTLAARRPDRGDLVIELQSSMPYICANPDMSRDDWRAVNWGEVADACVEDAEP